MRFRFAENPAFFHHPITASVPVKLVADTSAGYSGARELSESCVSQNSGSLENRTLCPSKRRGSAGGRVSPLKIFANYGHFCILSHFLAKMTCKTTCSRGHASVQNFLHIHV